MKLKQSPKVIPQSNKKPLTFGDFVNGVYKTWGQQKAAGIIQLALKMNLVEFRGAHKFVIS